MTTAPLSRGDLTRYALLAAPVAFAGFPLYILAPDFYATRYGVSLGTLGVLLLALRLFDAVQDPLIGRLSDRYHVHRAWFLPTCALLLCASIGGLFTLRPLPAPLWFTLCVALAVTSYSVLSINLAALGARWTRDTQEQVRVSAFREGYGLIGLLLGVSLPALLPRLVPGVDAYFLYTIFLSLLMLAALVQFRRWLWAQPATALRTAEPEPRLRQLLAHVDRRFLAIYSLSMLASALPAALVVFFIRDRLGAELLKGVFLLLYFLSGAVAMPVWRFVSRLYGTRRAWAASMTLAAVTFVWAFFLAEGDTIAYGLVCVFSGMALGADLAIPPAMLADDLHRRGMEAQAATHFSLLTLLSKAALALASAVALPLLALSGFTPAQANGPDALQALSALYSLVPCVLKLAAAVLLLRPIHPPSLEASHETHFSDNIDSGSHHHA